MKQLLGILGICMLGCGGAASNQEATSPPVADDAAEVESVSGQSETVAKPVAPTEITSVTRADIDDILRNGPAGVLQQVQVDSVMSDGRFVGFRIISFRGGYKSVLGLTADDVLTKVNDLPIATPSQYDEIFKRLTSASEITFSIIRNGEPMELRSPIE